MDIYIDSANLDEIQEAKQIGLADGVTTNPTLIAKARVKEFGKDAPSIIRDICQEVSGPVHVEVVYLEYEKMVSQGKQMVKIAPNVILKIPMMADGLRAAKTFSEEGIKTNITLIFSAGQAILAAKAGATYVCPFLGRLDDISHDGLALLEQIKTIFSANPDIKTKIIAASIRTPIHVVELAEMGVDILTVPSKVLHQMKKHPLTDAGIAQFMEDAEKLK